MYNIMQQHINRNPSVYIRTVLRLYCMARKSHYDILQLRRNCSDKDIKEAFIKLSKQYHPDKNKDVNAQQHFVRIVEAYNILSKSNSRALYDRKTNYEPYPDYPPYQRAYSYNVRNMRPQQEPPPHQNFYQDTSSYARKQNTSSQSENAYYGAVGVKKIPTYFLVILCVGIAFVGTVLQVLVIRGAYNVNKKKITERNEYLVNELIRVRDGAVERSNETQTRILLEKIVGSSNPTIATASLGHALAAEKKDPSPEPDSPSILADLGLNEISNFWYTPKQETPFTDVLGKLNRFYMYYYYHRR